MISKLRGTPCVRPYDTALRQSVRRSTPVHVASHQSCRLLYSVGRGNALLRRDALRKAASLPVHALIRLQGSDRSVAVGPEEHARSPQPDLLAICKVLEQTLLDRIDHGAESTINELARGWADAILHEMRALFGGLTLDRAHVTITPLIQGRAQGSLRRHASAGGRPDVKQAVFVALGSNVGHRFQAIEAACRSMDNSGNIRIVETSPLYETAPMYVADQETFLNGMCKV